MEVGMAVDKIISEIAANATVQDRLDTVRKVRDEKATSAQNKEAAASQDNTDLSSEARKLQETERILRFALERLEQFDEVRHEKLDEITTKLDGNFYSSEDINGEVSERIFSDEELQERVRRNQQMRGILEDVRQMDEQSQSVEVDMEKIKAIRAKVDEGFYNSEEVLGQVADRLLELTE